ncbi:hypothetical protein AGMMS50218_03140 [Actinomycetota bacterium]|nr:hypothetical protein AGMMS50218_03140 [Actinomycetota bacterium]
MAIVVSALTSATTRTVDRSTTETVRAQRGSRGRHRRDLAHDRLPTALLPVMFDLALDPARFGARVATYSALPTDV